MMNYRRLSVVVEEAPPRGNASGYTGADYARDSAAEIERELADYLTWPDDANSTANEATARRMAEQKIEEYRRSIGSEYLKIVVETFTLDD